MVAPTPTFDEYEVQEGGRAHIRRQVSDLGMEDPVMEPRRSKRPTPATVQRSTPDDCGDSNASTCLGDSESTHHFVSDDEKEQECSNKEDTELDVEDLMSLNSKSSSSKSSNASHFLKAMSDSFTNGSINNMSFSGSSSSLGDSQNSMSLNDEAAEESGAGKSSSSPSPSRGRRLPSRSGSGYVRGIERSTSSPKEPRARRASIVNNGFSAGAAALRQKRRSSAITTTVASAAAAAVAAKARANQE